MRSLNNLPHRRSAGTAAQSNTPDAQTPPAMADADLYRWSYMAMSFGLFVVAGEGRIGVKIGWHRRFIVVVGEGPYALK
jgi:hypothetical protein